MHSNSWGIGWNGIGTGILFSGSSSFNKGVSHVAHNLVIIISSLYNSYLITHLKFFKFLFCLAPGPVPLDAKINRRSMISRDVYLFPADLLIPGPLFSWLAPARNYWGTIDQGSGPVRPAALFNEASLQPTDPRSIHQSLVTFSVPWWLASP